MTATERADAPRPAGEQHDDDAAQLAALAYGVAAAVSLAWPRTPDVAWIVILSTAVVLAVGLLYMIGARPWQKSAAAAGDAVTVRGGA